tara:strand:- start:511 stop:1320 length:810 start_codon:yes stop_codon:yes gene_type:complete
MKIFSNKSELLKIIHNEKNLGFVPTMGSFHLGHIYLIKRCIKECDKSIVSIFINKPQFNKKEDFKKYPRNIKKDILILKKLKVDYLFLPTFKQLYPNGTNNKIKIDPFGKKLCGKYRKGHFEAIVDVVDRFIKIIKPIKIYFGEKDMQQLKIVEQYIKTNNIKTKLIACKTIREKNGIAHSSRNLLLTENEKEIASKIYKFILKKKNLLIKNKITKHHVKKKMFKLGIKKIDYVEIIDLNKIIKPYKNINKYKIFIAYYLKSTRLIDNI